jgi:tRNA threonylcarbamoyladenosine biosynthesis protein TsaE
MNETTRGMTTLETHSPAETKKLGERLARLLRPGDVLLLQGELGAGKTCLTQGIGRGLRVKEIVKSSSFVLVNEYDGRLHVWHADLFRLGDPEEVADLYLEENARDGLLIVEWPEVAMGALPEQHLLLRFEMIDNHARRIVPEPRGERAEELAREFTAPAKLKPRVGG